MKKYNYLHAVLLVMLAASTFSCKKKKSEPSPQERILGKWKIVAWTAKVSNDPSPPMDVFASLPNCEKDNFFEYRSGGVLIFNEGSTKCNNNDPQEQTTTYTLSADGRTLTWSLGNNQEMTFEVLELSSSVKRLKYMQNDQNITYTMEITFNKM